MKRGVVAFLLLIGTLAAQQFPPPSDSGSSGGIVTWGSILGSVTNQVDLANALSNKLGYRGVWTSTAAYAANDVVTLNGYGYMAMAANTNTPVSNTSVWLWFGSSSSGSSNSIAIPSAGIVKSNGISLLTATAGTDYLTASTGVTSINGQTGAVTVASTSPPAQGMVKSSGTLLQTAVAGTDYLSPSTGVTTFNGQSGAVTGVTTVNGQSGAVTVGSTAAPATPGVVRSTGTALATAVDGTDYLSPSTGVTSVNGNKGAISVITAPALGMVKSSGTGGNLQTAVPGTDYLSPTTGVTSVNGSTGAVTISVASAPSTPGIVRTTGSALATAVAGTDYLSPSTGVTSVNGSTGAVTVVTSVNGSTGAVNTVTAPALGIVKSSGTNGSLQTAVAGTDYMAPSTSVTTTQLPAVAKGKTCEIHIWGSGSGGALQVSDYEPVSCFNDAAAAMTITKVRCYADQGSTTQILPQITGLSSTSILTGALTCSSTFASGTLTTPAPTIPSGGTIDLNISNPGLATFIRVIITGTF